MVFTRCQKFHLWGQGEGGWEMGSRSIFLLILRIATVTLLMRKLTSLVFGIILQFKLKLKK